jgi:hypothetical protein
MAKRIDSPLGGLARKADRQRAERQDRRRKRKLDRVAEAFEQRSRARDRTDRSWRNALTSGRAPFPKEPLP